MAHLSGTIGVLALQGCVTPHRPHVEALGFAFREIRTAEEMAGADGLILPGGESTTMLRLIDRFGLEDALRAFAAARPVWGICAGAILMARGVRNPPQRAFGLVDMDVVRNGYGRQLDSVQQAVDGYPVSFIRAPVIERAGPSVEVLARRDGDPVWLTAGHFMVTTFHAELTLDFPSPQHRAFARLIAEARQPA